MARSSTTPPGAAGSRRPSRRRFGVTADGSWNIAFADWLSVCRKTEAASREAAR